MNDPIASAPVLTALDMPAASPGGSIELLYDLYTGPAPLIDAQAFMLATDRPHAHPPTGVRLMSARGKCVDGDPFWAYVGRLRQALDEAVDPAKVEVIHLQHLAFGASAALTRSLPQHPALSLVHGTDLLFAAAHPTQRQVLAETVAASRAVVVPTTAMADRLIALHEPSRNARIEHIPWGIPDRLLHTPPLPRQPRQDELRVLYAGRLTPEKGLDSVFLALADTAGLQLSVAAPPEQYASHALRSDRRHTYLGWLPRKRLWQEFADHDLLIVPSTILEAFGLVALEAQACGLPVLYQPVPGLTEVLGDSALSANLADPAIMNKIIRNLQADPTILDDLRVAGLDNAARFPLSATAKLLTDLTQQIT
ncbi:glycosyltransferase family 4 protein [Nonomuraea sp. NPDC052129]|uniref:glycosyltransferase family 4 protein n=1 Tax=Nonomuraea sp. NPDC052129 TaxID=3154651 RepID=UPI00343C2CE7